MPSYDQILARFTAAAQEHALLFYPELSELERVALLKALDNIDVERCNSIFAKSTKPSQIDAIMSPLPASSFDSIINSNNGKVEKWNAAGMKLIAENKVAVILLAGGQGTRLGSSAPKGCYDISLPSHKSLFQLQGERILRLQMLASKIAPSGVAILPWYVMTSGPTRSATENFFKSKNYFGLDAANVIFFEQGVLPAFTSEGKIFMESKTLPAMSPDGNGGIYAALRNEGVISDLEKRGTPYIHAYCVDNCLVKVADPTFIGYCVEKNADCGGRILLLKLAKCVPKLSPEEASGVICLKNNKFNVIEYSEIDPALSKLTTSEGKLVYNAGNFLLIIANIANHFYTTEFLKKVNLFEGELEYHIAKKKITHVNSEGNLVKPTSNNGIKLELFIFDVFPFTERMAVLEVPREDEFSPLKNSPGCKDGFSPETSRTDIIAQHLRFVKAAGATIQGDGSLEISPLVSYAGEGLEVLKGVTIKTPKLIETEDELKALASQ